MAAMSDCMNSNQVTSETTTTIPVPGNPCHVDNLKTIALLDAQGFEGPDASLTESLFEYGLAWRELSDNEILFVHRNSSMQGRFERTTFKADLDVQKEFNWVSWDSVMSCIGVNLAEWLTFPLPYKIQDLVSYYGEMEIFGESYWEGFAIADPSKADEDDSN